MSESKIRGNDLIAIGWPQGPAIGVALATAQRLRRGGRSKRSILAELAEVATDPERFLGTGSWKDAAQLLYTQRQRESQLPEVSLRSEPAPLAVWGRELIDEDSFKQIRQAATLPVTLKVALMPDAHIGYGLPIGGVAALEGAIAPYMVGVDIGCRMHATIFARNPIHLDQDKRGYMGHLMNHTYFGRQGPSKSARNRHEILDDARWAKLPPALRGLKELAAAQLGTSGGGNHFVEWTNLSMWSENPFGLPAGEYIALVSHSGSRGVGFKIANHYSQIAEKMCTFLPHEIRRLAYLDYRTGDGQEYEMAMNLAGDFAKANHEVIHRRIVAEIGRETVLATLQNHHNFAWRVDREDQSPVFIHRKGATPAERGVTGIIPGSMGTPGFFVTGLGDQAEDVLQHPSLNSAAHGSGRVLGRRQAHRALNANAVRSALKEQGVTLLGGGLDEAPDAYKDSRQVIAAQSDLVKVWAEFKPRIVRMESPRGKSLGRNA